MSAPHELDQLACEIGLSSPWGGFARFLALRAPGRRKDAMRMLDAFLEEAVDWSFEERQAFVRWITRHASSNRLVMPEPLQRRLVSPTLVEWLVQAPDSSEANLLFGLHATRPFEGGPTPSDYLRKAIALDPDNQVARRAFVELVIACVRYAQHELPLGYLGSAADDVPDLEYAIGLLPGSESAEADGEQAAELKELLAAAKAWTEYVREG